MTRRQVCGTCGGEAAPVMCGRFPTIEAALAFDAAAAGRLVCVECGRWTERCTCARTAPPKLDRWGITT